MDKDFIPTLPFEGYKWKWASYQCTEGLNDPVVLLGVLFRMRKLEKKGLKYSSEEFAKELESLSHDISDSIKVDLARRTGPRNLIRNSGQYWRAVGLLEPGEHSGKIRLTDFGHRVADRKISQSEFAAITIQTYKLPNVAIHSADEINKWKTHGIEIYPLKLLLAITRELYNHDSSDGYITIEELTKIIIPLSGCKVELKDYVDFIIRFRNGELDISNWPNCCPAANDLRIAREYLLFLSNYGYIEKSPIRASRLQEKYCYIYALDDEITAILSRDESEHPLISVADNVTDIASEMERKRVRNSRYRPNQSRFRKEVLEACQRCIITNVTMPEILEAAHIKPFKYNGEDTVANGFAMRTDVHILFDAGHLRISPDGNVELSDRARMDYGAVIPPRIVIPDFTNREFLRWRWDNYNGI